MNVIVPYVSTSLVTHSTLPEGVEINAENFTIENMSSTPLFLFDGGYGFRINGYYAALARSDVYILADPDRKFLVGYASLIHEDKKLPMPKRLIVSGKAYDLWQNTDYTGPKAGWELGNGSFLSHVIVSSMTMSDDEEREIPLRYKAYYGSRPLELSATLKYKHNPEYLRQNKKCPRSSGVVRY